MDISDQGQNPNDLQGNIQLLDNEQPMGISSAQYNQKSLSSAQGATKTGSTLDEPVSETIMRDLRMIWVKLRFVLMPKQNQEDGNELKNWDLWGPLLLCLCLACTLGLSTSKQAEIVFAIIFVIIWVGAGFVTLNAKLLGGQISFFQSVCLLGYCVFPINIASFISMMLPSDSHFFQFIKLGLCAVSFIWSTRASIPFFKTLVKEEKQTLAVYPVFLFYLSLSWFVLLA